MRRKGSISILARRLKSSHPSFQQPNCSRRTRSTFVVLSKGSDFQQRNLCQRCFSSSGETYDDDQILLYQRNPERNVLPRAAFGFSIFNSTYWLWYVLDFIPAVNNTTTAAAASSSASAVDLYYIHPAVGLGGLALGASINLVTGLYPYSLISKLSYSPKRQKLYLWNHDLPWIRQSKRPIEYPIGSLQVNNSDNTTTQRLLQKSYVGHLGISVQGQTLPMLMEIRQESSTSSSSLEEEVPDPQLLLQTLLDPHALAIAAEAEDSSKVNKKKKHQKGGQQSKRRRN